MSVMRMSTKTRPVQLSSNAARNSSDEGKVLTGSLMTSGTSQRSDASLPRHRRQKTQGAFSWEHGIHASRELEKEGCSASRGHLHSNMSTNRLDQITTNGQP